jgi:hypothetical protein
LVEQENLPFQAADCAVTLFAIQSGYTEGTFRQAGARLLTIFSLSDPEMQRIVNEDTKELMKDVASFKRGFGVVTTLP